MRDVFGRIDQLDERQRFEGLWPAMYSPWQLLNEFFPADRRQGPTVEVAEDGDDVLVRVNCRE